MSKKLPYVSSSVVPQVKGIKIKSPVRKARLSGLIKGIDGELPVNKKSNYLNTRLPNG